MSKLRPKTPDIYYKDPLDAKVGEYNLIDNENFDDYEYHHSVYSFGYDDLVATSVVHQSMATNEKSYELSIQLPLEDVKPTLEICQLVLNDFSMKNAIELIGFKDKKLKPLCNERVFLLENK